MKSVERFFLFANFRPSEMLLAFLIALIIKDDEVTKSPIHLRIENAESSGFF